MAMAMFNCLDAGRQAVGCCFRAVAGHPTAWAGRGYRWPAGPKGLAVREDVGVTIMTMRIFTVDCFAERPFAGNPNAVCLVESAWPDDDWLQRVAGELNLPATAFVDRGRPHPTLRWFSPRNELALCGSGTLAAAHVLWESGEWADLGAFNTCAGALRARQESDRRITMDFPVDDPRPVPAVPTLTRALGANPVAVLRGRLDLLVELDSAQTVRGLTPQLTALARLDVRGVIVTAAGGTDSDFVSRFFAPAAGIDEDPVTASAHCSLAPYWSKKLGKNALTGLQVSARGGRVEAHVRGDRVSISGRAVTVAQGELLVSPPG